MGGATTQDAPESPLPEIVSIAEAILWGEQPTSGNNESLAFIVSIAEAILWGEQRQQ